MATSHACGRKASAANEPVPLKRLLRVARAGRRVPARRWEERRERDLIDPDQQDHSLHQPARDHEIPDTDRSLSRSSRIPWKLASRASGFAITTKSRPGGSCLCRRTSRINRRTRLRTTALPTRLLAVIPTRDPLATFLCMRIRTTSAPCCRRPCCWTRRNSLRRRRRAFLGKPLARATPQPGCFGGTDTVSRFRPFARRRRSTLRPEGVAIRARNPCVRFRRRLLG